jgi:glycosyltransferase involved in cell wall biosynthesis
VSREKTSRQNWSPILSIGIPTFNRARLLEDCLNDLTPLLEAFCDSIELLISDNNSDDDTREVLNRFFAKNETKFSIKINTNALNIGAVANIFELFNLTSARYLMFLGDDDGLIIERVPQLIKAMSESEDCHFVQGDWPWRESLTGQTIVSSAADWGYEMGLGWGSLYNVRACQTVLQVHGMPEKLSETIWGQISLALLSIEIDELKVVVLPFSWGYVSRARPYSYDYENLLISFHDILEAHRIASSLSATRHLQVFARLSNHGFRAHLLGLIVQVSESKRPIWDEEIWKKIGLISKDLKSPGSKVVIALSHLLTRKFLALPLSLALCVRRGFSGLKKN